MGRAAVLRVRFDAAFAARDWQKLFEVMKEMRNW